MTCIIVYHRIPLHHRTHTIMKTTSFIFTVGNRSGNAVIVDLDVDVKQTAQDAFDNDFESKKSPVSIREIGTCEGPSQPGYRDTYRIYESYVDSGSEDYYYFAVPIMSEEK
jgi:hypothetical protein